MTPPTRRPRRAGGPGHPARDRRGASAARRAAMAAGGVALAAGLGGCGLGLQQAPTPGGPGGPTYSVRATFANVLNLPIGAKVRDGVAVVGDVSAITARHFAAQATLTISSGVKLPVGTTAQVRFESPLGDDFVQLHPPQGRRGGPYLHDGSRIPEVDTATAPSIEDLLASLASVLNGSGLQQVQTIVTNVNQALGGNTGNVQALIDDLDQLTGSLAAHAGDIDSALQAMATLTQQLAAGSGTITQGLDAITPAVQTLVADNRSLDQLVGAVNQVTATANSVVQQSGRSTVADIQALVPVVQQLVGVNGQIQGDLSDFAAFEKRFPSVTPGNYLQLSLAATIVFPPNALTGANPPTAHTASTTTPDAAFTGRAAGALSLLEPVAP